MDLLTLGPAALQYVPHFGSVSVCHSEDDCMEMYMDVLMPRAQDDIQEVLVSREAMDGCSDCAGAARRRYGYREVPGRVEPGAETETTSGTSCRAHATRNPARFLGNCSRRCSRSPLPSRPYRVHPCTRTSHIHVVVLATLDNLFPTLSRSPRPARA